MKRQMIFHLKRKSLPLLGINVRIKRQLVLHNRTILNLVMTLMIHLNLIKNHHFGTNEKRHSSHVEISGWRNCHPNRKVISDGTNSTTTTSPSSTTTTSTREIGTNRAAVRMKPRSSKTSDEKGNITSKLETSGANRTKAALSRSSKSLNKSYNSATITSTTFASSRRLRSANGTTQREREDIPHQPMTKQIILQHQ